MNCREDRSRGSDVTASAVCVQPANSDDDCRQDAEIAYGRLGLFAATGLFTRIDGMVTIS